MTKRNAEITAIVSMTLLGLLIFHILWNVQVWFIKFKYSFRPPVIYIKEVK